MGIAFTVLSIFSCVTDQGNWRRRKQHNWDPKEWRQGLRWRADKKQEKGMLAEGSYQLPSKLKCTLFKTWIKSRSLNLNIPPLLSKNCDTCTSSPSSSRVGSLWLKSWIWPAEPFHPAHRLGASVAFGTKRLQLRTFSLSHHVEKRRLQLGTSTHPPTSDLNRVAPVHSLNTVDLT